MYLDWYFGIFYKLSQFFKTKNCPYWMWLWKEILCIIAVCIFILMEQHSFMGNSLKGSCTL